MKKLASSILVFLSFASWTWPGQQQATNPPLQSQESTPVLREGRIVSVDVAGKSIVVKAKIEREDTFSVDSVTIIKPAKPHSTVRDLVLKSLVRVRYAIKEGKKVATHIILQPLWRESPPPIVKGENAIVAEGVIQSINNKGDVMIIRAAVEQQDTFAIDSTAIVKAGNRVSSLNEIKNYISVNVHYTVKEGRKIVNKIIGTVKRPVVKKQTAGL
jgi:hypothetical protein